MDRTVPIVVVAVVAAGLSWWGRGLMMRPASDGMPSMSAGEGPCPGGAEAEYWKAPMDPTYIRKQPGKSPMGMDLVPVCPEETTAGSGVHIEPGMIQNMGVKMARVERTDLTRSIRAVGRVDYDERRVAHVHTKVQGWIEKLFVEYEGETVERGTPMLEIYSPELLATQEELLIAKRYRETTGASDSEDVRAGGQSLLDATRRRLELWDIPDREIDALLERGTVRKTLTLVAPSSGVVTQMMARHGMEVNTEMNLYTIADLSRVWVYANVYEYELPWVAVGQRATVELSYLPGRTFEGEVTYVYPFLDPKTRTARVRVELENPDRILKPDMFANVEIHAEELKDVLTVPEAAVIRSGRRTLVVVALGEGRFEPREVVLGVDSGDGQLEILEGLAESERIVTSGQFLIDSESKLQDAVQKMREEDSEPAGEPEPGPMEGMDMPMPRSDGAPLTSQPMDMTDHAGHE
jgi:Cu(I)/Ag(I) efflux system membrane fusion protein/cobalt-zinc-cadmium efflux system membrane fusion protein